jgi:hypothetical protein
MNDNKKFAKHKLDMKMKIVNPFLIFCYIFHRIHNQSMNQSIINERVSEENYVLSFIVDMKHVIKSVCFLLKVNK